MRIVVPESFRHAGDLTAQEASLDPREPLAATEEVEIDLRGCNIIRPPGILWCAVYCLLVTKQGIACRLLVPENFGVCVYLQSIGLFSLLKDGGVDVDDRQIPARTDPKVLLSLTRFHKQAEVDQLTDLAVESLEKANLGAANLYPLVAGVFAELANNALQHAESPIGAIGLMQLVGQRVLCTIGDGGMGVRRSLERNPALKSRVPYDWVALDLALRERVSGTGQPTRGIGLSWISDEMRKGGRQLIIHSEFGMLSISEEAESESRRINLFPGTLAFASILM